MTLARWAAGCATAAVLATMSVAGPVAQESTTPVKSAPAQAADTKTMVPLKVTVLISRVLGEKKTASLPFTLWVNANDCHGTSLRMSESVPVPGGANRTTTATSARTSTSRPSRSTTPVLR